MSSLTVAISWFQPLKTAIANPQIPWAYRWRLLPLQAIIMPMYLYEYLRSPPHLSIQIPTRGKHTLRAIVFLPSQQNENQSTATQQPRPRPLHIDFHGGAFLGGIAEFDAPFCERVRSQTVAVVISVQYRHAPAHLYPAAHEDAADAVAWISANALDLWNADPSMLTVSGFSAGANLMMVAGERAKAAVGFYAPVDLRLPPWEKPKPPGYPSPDPLSWLEPLYDAYASGCQRDRQHDARLSPIMKNIDELPRKVLLIVPAIDILYHEQMSFIERLREDVSESEDGRGRRMEAVVFEKGFHGWLEVPPAIIDNRNDREKAYQAAIDFIAEAHRS